MNNYEKVLNYAKENNGYITRKNAKELKVHQAFLSILVREGKLENVGKGVYKLPEYPIDYFYILSKSSDRICFSHTASLYLLNMTDRIPLVYDITVPYNYNGSLLKRKDVSLKYVRDDVWDMGVEIIPTVNDLPVKCYNLERTICDIIKDKKNMDREIFSKALKEYAKNNNKDILKLVKYARKLNIEDDVVEIMEVIL